MRLRFLENNDVPRFITTHGVAQTKMAAALLFALPGIPMLYNGQEVGCGLYPYSSKTIFTADKTIQQSDTTGLFDYYKKIIHLRSAYPALSGKSIASVKLLNNPCMMAFERFSGNQHVIVIINLNNLSANAQLNNKDDNKLKSSFAGTACLQDLLTGSVFKIHQNNTPTVAIPMEGYGIRWLLLPKKTQQNQFIN